MTGVRQGDDTGTAARVTASCPAREWPHCDGQTDASRHNTAHTWTRARNGHDPCRVVYNTAPVKAVTCNYFSKSKAKVTPRTGHKDPEGEQRYSFTLSWTSALDEVGGQSHAPAALHPGKTRYPLYKRLGGPQDRSGRVRKISSPHWDSILGRPNRSDLPYRLSYPGTQLLQ